MALYAIDQRVWVRSAQQIGIVQEARYVTTGGKRKAEYVILMVEDCETDRNAHPTFMTGSKDLHAADWCCETCSRWLPGRPFRSETIYAYGEYEDCFNFCFLCINMLEASKEQREMAAADGYAWQT